MRPLFSLVYPTRHRPEFVQQALRILELQQFDDFEVVVSDNYVDASRSCEQICRDSSLAKLKYVRSPRPLGMVENWNHALQFATGEYICYLTDKMFVLPDALGRIDRAITSAGSPDIVSWTSDAYNPYSFSDYFGGGRYSTIAASDSSDTFVHYSPAADLDRRATAVDSRTEQSPADYCRGKLVFGAYHHKLVERLLAGYGQLFHNISPDYTSMVLGLSEARDGIELQWSCVVSVNTDISNGHMCDTDDLAALAFLESLAGGAASIVPSLLVPGLYASLHNWVAHDYLTLKETYNLDFAFNALNWITHVFEDIHRPGRAWSSREVESEQKAILASFIDNLEPQDATAVRARLAARARQVTSPSSGRALLRLAWRRYAPELLRRIRRDTWQRVAPAHAPDAPSIEVAITRRVR